MSSSKLCPSAFKAYHHYKLRLFNTVASESLSFGAYSTVNVMDLQSEVQLQEMLKAFKASQTLTKLEMQNMLRKILSNSIQLDDPKLSVYTSPYSSICPNRLSEFRSDEICWSMTSATRNCLMKTQILALRISLHPSSISTS